MFHEKNIVKNCKCFYDNDSALQRRLKPQLNDKILLEKHLRFVSFDKCAREWYFTQFDANALKI